MAADAAAAEVTVEVNIFLVFDLKKKRLRVESFSLRIYSKLNSWEIIIFHIKQVQTIEITGECNDC